MITIFQIFAAILVCFISPIGIAQEKWDLRKSENGIDVYTRSLADERFKEVKIVAELPGTPAQLLSIILDANNHKKWVYGVENSYLLKKINNNSIIYYSESDLPWPIQNRDMVVSVMVSRAPESQQTFVKAKSVPEFIPPKNNIVRIPSSTASWEITPLPDNKMKVIYFFSVDPGGSLPPWLINSIAVTGPYNSFVELKKILESKVD